MTNLKMDMFMLIWASYENRSAVCISVCIVTDSIYQSVALTPVEAIFRRYAAKLFVANDFHNNSNNNNWAFND